MLLLLLLLMMLLINRFNGKCMLGDQDWLTLLSWKMPAGFFQLPCAFNYVVSRVNKRA